jgi:ubiquinone/menaquinone biosynthesis C-methylase UbiE
MTDRFREWLRQVHSAGQSRRTAERNAGFLLPHLKPGMRVLDAGCGGGSITVGLADAVAPGEVVGIDVNERSVEAAGDLAKRKEASNVRFEVADVNELPFDDGSFDAVFSHALLQHVESPATAVRQMRRVVRPGGVIGIADADFGSAITHPSSPALERGAEIWRMMRPSPLVGRALCQLLVGAGCERVEGSYSGGGPANQNTVAANGEFWAQYFEAEPFIEHAEAEGWAIRGEMLAVAAAWREWSRTPGAFWASYWCQALGWAPHSGAR